MYVGLIMMRMKMVFIFVIKMYMYNRKYVLKFYDDDFSLVIRVCEILLKKRDALKFEFELIMMTIKII